MISFRIYKQLQTTHGAMPLDISCQLQPGAITAIYGPSGAGKTTTLRILAGLLQPENGYIDMNGETWLDTANKHNMPAQQRSTGFVFQDYALFPNMTVQGNLEYALQKGQPKNEINSLVEVMELEGLLHRYPATLSGGQKQRVAVARALVRRPALLLLDEPLAALDNEMRVKLQSHILKVHKAFGLTTILVSHDIPELHRMADVVFVLELGKIARQGTPAAIFGSPDAGGGFSITGEILAIENMEPATIATLLIGNQAVKITVAEEDANHLGPGDMVNVSAPGFIPRIKKLEL